MIGQPFGPAAAEEVSLNAHRLCGAGRCVGDIMPRLTPPTITTLLISLILAVVAVVGQYSHQISNIIPVSMFWLAVIAYIVLLLGNLIRGL